MEDGCWQGLWWVGRRKMNDGGGRDGLGGGEVICLICAVSGVGIDGVEKGWAKGIFDFFHLTLVCVPKPKWTNIAGRGSNTLLSHLRARRLVIYSPTKIFTINVQV